MRCVKTSLNKFMNRMFIVCDFQSSCSFVKLLLNVSLWIILEA